jgi:hypothetical protein
MHRSIIQAPPYSGFELNISEIITHVLRIKIDDRKIPGYHFSLCKLGLQLFDENHIKVDYELAIKRYLYENGDAAIGLSQFMKMLKDNFKEVSQSTSTFVEIITTEGQGKAQKTIKIPFLKSKCEELLQDKSNKYTIQLK